MYDYATGQQTFDASVNIPAETLRVHMLVEDLQAKHKSHIKEHGKYPMAYWDEVDALAKAEGFEFLHPKFAGKPKVVEHRPTVH